MNNIYKIENTGLTIKECNTSNDGKLEMEIRVKVFMVEQGFTFESEFDSEEYSSVGYLIYYNDTPVGVFNYVLRDDHHIFFRRLCFLKEYRKMGFGKHIFKFMEDMLSKMYSPLKITFNGEKYLDEYWKKLGYEILGEVSEGEGCPPLLLCQKIIK